MFRTILLIIVTLMHVYVFWRVASVPLIRAYVSRPALITIAMVLWVLFYAGRFFRHSSSGQLGLIFELFGMHWMAILFLLFVCFLIVDLVTGFGLFFPHITPLLRSAGMVAGLLLAAIAFVQGLRPPVIQSYEVLLPDLPEELDGTVIVGLSDTHLGSIIGENWLDRRVQQVKDQHPDMIVLLGDIFEGHDGTLDGFIEHMNTMSAPLGVWAVYGNHEHYRNHVSDDSVFHQSGFKVLHNQAEEVSPGFVIAGVDDLTVMRRRGGAGLDLVRQTLTNRPPGITLYLSHSPLLVDEASELGADIMVSGHTHAGQIWPFNYLVRQVYPYYQGRYEINGMTLIVCRGTGTWGPRMRLWRPGEILRITLRAER